MNAPACGRCKFYDRSRQMPGLCRRFPPAVLNTGRQVERRFPEMGLDEWCGEYQPKPEAPHAT